VDDYLIIDLELVPRDLCVHVHSLHSELGVTSGTAQAAAKAVNDCLTIASHVRHWRGSMEGHQLPQQIERNYHVFGPRELKRLALAFDRAWRQLRSEGIEGETFEEIELIRTKLAQSIIACATAREHDVEQLKASDAA
jgi:hypothetical protein